MLAKRFGGAERSFVDMCRALATRGHAVLAICEERSQALRYVGKIEGVVIQSLRVWGPWDVLARRTIRRYLQDFATDIAQMHLARAARISGPAARALGIPSIAKTHNYVKLKYYETINVLVPTTVQQVEYLVHEGIPGHRYSLIPNFSALAFQNPNELRRNPRNNLLRVVAVGRLVHKKGFDILLRAISIARGDGIALRLAIAGSGPERDALNALCRELQLQEVVTFLGWQDNIEECLAQADVFVLPSRDEPFGIVCLEAMALSVPIIATRTDGPAEILDANTAILIEPGDPNAMAEALKVIALQPGQAAERAVSARKRFAQSYSEQAVVTQYLALYERLIDSKRNSQNA